MLNRRSFGVIAVWERLWMVFLLNFVRGSTVDGFRSRRGLLPLVSIFFDLFVDPDAFECCGSGGRGRAAYF